MSADLDWARLEAVVSRAVERLRAVATENQTLRAEVARLEAEIESARAGDRGAGVNDGRTEEMRRRLSQLEGEIESLLG
jgi:outer membrane murein-binding lipoprotein Lpp